MTLFRLLALTCLAFCIQCAMASDRATIVRPDNVTTCQAGAGCTNQTHYGRVYKVITTQRFTVMLSISVEGPYTRADVAIANNSGLPLNLSPSDFRIEGESSKPRIYNYVPPSERKPLPPPPADPAPAAATKAPAETTSTTAPQNSNIDELYAAAKKKEALEEAADRAAAQKDLPEGTIAPNQTLLGRVYFQRDKVSKKGVPITVVLPIAGEVFEFPYTLLP